MIEFENHDIIIELTPEGRDGASVTARGEWEADEHYYYLDIVSYNGGSYLAKTDVPAGTLPTNTTYWQVVASNAHWGDITGDLSDQEDLQAALDSKADANSVYTKTEADALLDGKADKNSVYSKTEADALLAGKANASDVYTKTQVDDALDLKADKADSYTKDELDGIFDGIDNALDSKADADSVYTKAQTNTLLAAKANTADLGTMAGVNDAPSDGKEYARKNGQWAEVVGGAGSTAWGEITGDLDDQTDLKNALDAKANTADLGALADQDTVDYETEVTNKPTLGTMSAESASDYYDKTEVNDLINNSGVVAELDASGSIATFETNLAENLSRLTVGIDPVQDLHGYDAPWPAGGGKNLLPLTLTDFKSKNSGGTWNGNVYTYDGFTITVSTTADDYITQIVINGSSTSSSTRNFQFASELQFSENVVLNGCPSGGAGSTFYIFIGSVGYDYGNGCTINANTTTGNIQIHIEAGYNANNLVFKPMVRPSSVSDATFAPYSNICPISGHTSATVTRTGKNMLNGSAFGTYSNWSHSEFGGTYKSDSSNGTLVIPTVTGKTYTLTIQPISTSDVPQYFSLCKANANDKTVTSLVGRFTDTAYLTSNITFTSDGSIYYIRLNGTETEANFNARIAKLSYEQLELSSSATAYESPHVQTVTIALGDTRYGGTLDVLTGTLTVTSKLETLVENSVIAVSSGTGYYQFTYFVDQNVGAVGGSLESICNRFPRISLSDRGSISGLVGYDGDNSYRFSLNASMEITTVEEFKAYYAENPIMFTLKYKTPVSVSLTPAQIQALIGLNNVWADTGDVAVSYFNNNTAEAITDVKQMIASTETSMTATRNYTSGSLIIVGPALLKATSNISSGASLVIGTNCVRTTLEEWILSLIA